MTDTLIREDVDTVTTTTTETDEPIYAHIIDRGDDPRPAWVLILEARVEGTPITAICGYSWVPSRDPGKHPVCSKCQAFVDFAADMRNVHSNNIR